MGNAKSISYNTLDGPFKRKNDERICIIGDCQKPIGYSKPWPRISYFGLFDGHNGSEISSFLKQNFHNYLINNEYFPDEPYKAIKTAFNKAQKEIEEKIKNLFDKNNNLDLNSSNLKKSNGESIHNLSNLSISLNDGEFKLSNLNKCGSTVLIILMINDIVYVANVGDTRAIMSSEKMNNIYDLTEDHNLENDKEISRVKSRGGKIVKEVHPMTMQEIKKIIPGDIRITRSLGDVLVKSNGSNMILSEPEITSFKLSKKDDFIFIGSDGVFNTLDSKEIMMLILSKLLASNSDFKSFQTDDNIKVNLSSLNSEIATYIEKKSKNILIKSKTSKNYGFKYENQNKDNTKNSIDINHELNIKLKTIESDLIKSILKTSVLLGSSDNLTGILITFDNFKNLVSSSDEYLNDIYKKFSEIKNINKLKSQKIETIKPVTRVVFTKVI